MDLDLAQVRAFVAAAEEQHFGRAAARLFLTQQALSKRIARLEDGLGVRLLARDRHGVQLTEAGQRFLVLASRVLADGDQAVEAAAIRPGRCVSTCGGTCTSRCGHSGRSSRRIRS